MEDQAPGDIYATPKVVTDMEDCTFYHTMGLPGFGTVEGTWDLRQAPEEYLGGVDVGNKRVLDIGKGSGFLTFYMESRGAEVVAFDLNEEFGYDIAPGRFMEEEVSEFKERVRKFNNSFWLAHRVLNSKAKLVYGSVYDIPPGIGKFDTSLFGCVLLHLRDPFLALWKGSEVTRSTIIVTDILYSSMQEFTDRPIMQFHPNIGCKGNFWWELSPEIVVSFLRVLGFPRAQVSYHRQKLRGEDRALFTVVASAA